jgi:hypothetical protein
VVTCRELGVPCDLDSECCAGARCCFDGGSLRTECTDVAATGVCPGDPVGPVTCAAGMTNCNGTCVNLNTATFDCGACGNSCGIGGRCDGGVCAPALPQPLDCPAGQTDCGGYCADLNNDVYNCGRCNAACFIPIVGDNICVNGRCECKQFACL